MQTESVDETGSANEPIVPWTPPTWEEVVREHSGRVYRLAYRLTGNSHDAEDLTQEVFVRVFRSLPSYTPGTFEDFVRFVVPELQRRGIFQKDYKGATLRENLGLPWPERGWWK